MKRYPTVVLDMSTYPYFPGLPDDTMMDQTSLDGRKRLASYSRSADSAPESMLMPMPVPVPVSMPISTPKEAPKAEKEEVPLDKPAPLVVEQQQEPSENEVNNVADETSMSLSQPSSPQPPTSVNSQPKSVSPTQPPSSPPVPISPQLAAQPSPAKSPSSVKSPVPILAPSPQAKPEKRPPSRTKEDAIQQTKPHATVDPGDNFSRTDVKQTLKSMGLRCEDFTISVYSREQAHAILRKQGVEVTNHQPTKVPGTQPAPAPAQAQASTSPAQTPTPTSVPSQPQSPGQQQNQPPPPPQPQQQMPQSKPLPRPPSKPGKVNPTSGANIRPSVSVLRSEPTPRPQPAPPPPKSKVDDDDDDDCVILDPPEGPKPPNRFPHQFQLMGTTVQVNRGSKRQMRSMSHAPLPKRIHASRSYYYNEGYPYEESPEASVQDTLKRLKNYNISITCRRNSAQRHPRMHTMDSDSSDMDHDGSHLDSEDEEDMAKYLECEIDEEKELGLDTEGDEMLDLDSSGSINDISPERVDRRIAQPKKRSRAGNDSGNVEGLNSTVEIEDEEKDSENALSDSQKGEEREEASGFDRDNGPLDKMAKKCPEDSKIDEENDRLANTDEPRTILKTGTTEGDQEESSPISEWDRNRRGEGEDASKQELSGKDVQEGVENPAVDCKVDSSSTKVNEDHHTKTDLPVKNQLPKEATETCNPMEQPTLAKANNSASERKRFDSAIPVRKRQSSPLFQNWSSEDEIFESLIPKKDKKAKGKRKDDLFVPIDVTAGRDMCANLDDDINEELEKQLLEAGNLDDDDFEGDEMDGEGLDHFDLENEL